MAEGNGEIKMEEKQSKEEMEYVERTEDFSKLIQYGLDEKVAAKLDEIYKTGKLAHVDLDERALDALKEFPVDGALNVLTQFLESNLEHVSNKSAYLCGVMKTYRQKSRAGQGTGTSTAPKAPDEDKIKMILERTGYPLDVTTGQRKYGGPPPNWEGPTPGTGCEVFCGKIPKDMYEDELIPLFEKCGKIWDLRLMMDPMAGCNRGYAFITFTNREAAQQAVRELNDYEIRKGKKIGVTVSYNNHRLFVGNIPKNRDRDDLFEEFTKHAPGLTEVIIYSSPDDKKKNRGFCFLEYESHKAASLAKRRLSTGRIKVWGCDIIVDWADPQEEPDEQTMSKVRVLYVKNLTQDCSEEKLKESFEQYGNIERVKKIKDYAFVHFEERDNAVKAMNELNGKEIGGSHIEVSLAKPPSDKKKKEEMLRARERRMMQMFQGRSGGSPSHPSMMGGPMPVRGPGQGPRGTGAGMRGQMGRGDYDYDYDYYGYGDYRGGYSDPYYDDYYRYEDYYFDYAPPPPPARGRGRQPQPAGRGRGVVPRGRVGGPQVRGPVRGGRNPATSGARGVQRLSARGGVRAKGSLPGEDAGKRKFDGGHQNQGESKRRFQSNWGNQPLAQQPLGNAYGLASVNGGSGGGGGGDIGFGGKAATLGGISSDDHEWYQDSYQSWS
ncbi:heterogeneous nuclear ribonucleoprotein Q isoform X6 [Bombus vosnesenskii]|uniref:Heterogeneous nuclear ribonucleoprotein Q isoform X6 n=3 Tax=Bombus TaxID=28641 RepID=A0A6J3K1W9_9HYME|nr:heterogeneous nuclear ribonucleoprotein Q-like isoform X6 [Bombus vancouverensis nearcticus]XP_033303759.1 heterogeneous nuclear ribonucleoprotein Q isoform X6 [Bombus bifarius]XP_033347067.1 heterogeneous nuclear ribonucleoprotein Q isoform X6 [Bombus vosnesenskii]XP_043580095.1 heterogeneous nuclear ribonucleoprotein Q isoform X6 [Bombus pyrosoma]XP_048261027.1 heterogeneous nuclear ribonucleoprotein Q isoform X6 [Bombus terrestris]XP_050478684.1 heterogeneous nuclear ribonucleoprotein Q 